MAPPEKQNGSQSVLATLASSPNQWVQLATVGLVALSGFSNFAATWNSSDRNKTEIEVSRRIVEENTQRIREEARKQLDDLHTWIMNSTDEFHRGNEDSAANRRALARILDNVEGAIKNQTALLAGQKTMMENDSAVLGEVHKLVEQLATYKKLEQMRGAPE